MKETIQKIRVWYDEHGKGILTRCGLPDKLLSRSIGMFFVISIVQLLSARKNELNAIDGWKEYVETFPFAQKLLWVCVGFVLLTLLHLYLSKKMDWLDHAVLIVGALAFGICLVWRTNNFYLGISASAVAAIFITYAVGKLGKEKFEKLPDMGAGMIVFVSAVVVTVFVAVTTICNQMMFGTSTFDMGIFVQMFYSMKEHLTAVTTVERDDPISHFLVHTSFIYYVLMPLYWLIPKPETLLAAQAVLSVGGVIPLFMMARKHGFKGFGLVSICTVYTFFAGIILPCYYDFHENAFLPTLLMWLLYAMDQRKIRLFYIMSALTCIVKEDAPLYVICIALFFLFEEKTIKRIHGLGVSLVSGIYFVVVTNWLAEYGDGKYMAATRFGNLTISQEEGFAGIVKNVLVDPGYFFSLMLKEETLLFFLETMVPLLFLPFMTKHIHRFLLIVPYVIMNLVIGAGYGYAANIGFQYIFGPSALLIYMMFRNVEDMGEERRNRLVAAAASVAVITVVALGSGKIGNWERFKEKEDYWLQADACIQSIPEDARVLANIWLLPHAANRDEINSLDDNDFVMAEGMEKTPVAMKDLDKYDFVLMSQWDERTAWAKPYLEEAGFKEYAYTDGFILIYVSPSYQFDN